MPPLLASHHQAPRGAKRRSSGPRRLVYGLLSVGLVVAVLATSSTLCAMMHMMLSYR